MCNEQTNMTVNITYHYIFRITHVFLKLPNCRTTIWPLFCKTWGAILSYDNLATSNISKIGQIVIRQFGSSQHYLNLWQHLNLSENGFQYPVSKTKVLNSFYYLFLYLTWINIVFESWILNLRLSRLFSVH